MPSTSPVLGFTCMFENTPCGRGSAAIAGAIHTIWRRQLTTIFAAEGFISVLTFLTNASRFPSQLVVLFKGFFDEIRSRALWIDIEVWRIVEATAPFQPGFGCRTANDLSRFLGKDSVVNIDSKAARVQTVCRFGIVTTIRSRLLKRSSIG